MQILVQKPILHSCLLIAAIFFIVPNTTLGTDTSGYSGWENDSKYNSYYNYKERDSLKGKITQFKEVSPLRGMDPGTAFILEEGGEKILVHLCPVAFSNAKETGIRKGVKTKVKGCWALINGKDVFLAAKVKQGDSFVFKVRFTKDGRPFWNLSPEELAKERSAG